MLSYVDALAHVRTANLKKCNHRSCFVHSGPPNVAINVEFYLDKDISSKYYSMEKFLFLNKINPILHKLQSENR